jgi:hypothetical protein
MRYKFCFDFSAIGEKRKFHKSNLKLSF